MSPLKSQFFVLVEVPFFNLTKRPKKGWLASGIFSEQLQYLLRPAHWCQEYLLILLSRPGACDGVCFSCIDSVLAGGWIAWDSRLDHAFSLEKFC